VLGITWRETARMSYLGIYLITITVFWDSVFRYVQQ